MPATSLINSEAPFQLAALYSSSEVPDMDVLGQEYPDLIRSIGAFDPNETMALVAGLLTLPQFHANTIRLELLQHFVHRNAVGKNKPTRNRIRDWVNQGLNKGWAAQKEDPVEDVFISNVVCSSGNSRIFEGTWEGNDYWLQGALNALKALDNESWAAEAMENCRSLLDLSEALADRCHLQRFRMGGGSVRTNLEIPPQQFLYERALLVRFSRRELEALGSSYDRIAPFIHDETRGHGGIGKSTLERRPLVQDGNGILIAIPAAISSAIRTFIAEEVVRAGAVERFERVLFAHQGRELFDEGIRALGGKPIDKSELPSLPSGAAISMQALVEFDRGKFAYLAFVEDPVLGFLETGPAGIFSLIDENGKSALQHVSRCIESVASRPDYRGGLTMVIHGGMGRAFMFGAGEPPRNWHHTGFHLHDFLFLGRARRVDFLTMWKLMEQASELLQRRIRITNPFNGELNLLGFWQRNGERFVRPDCQASDVTIAVATDFLAEVRRDLRQTHDFHAVQRRNPNIWVPVRRYNLEPYFKEAAADPIYVSSGELSGGELRALIETPSRGWWVSVLRPQHVTWHRNIQFRIWDAVLSWMVEVAPLAEEVMPTLPNGPIEVFLEFEGLEDWTTPRIDDLPESQEIDLRVNPEVSGILLILPLGFLRHFANSSNIAERKLIWACFAGAAALNGTRLPSSELASLVQRVVRSDDARFFHLGFAQNVRQELHSVAGIKPRFVRDGDLHHSWIGMSQQILRRRDQKTVSGAGECNKFLNSVVDECWSRIRSLLEHLDRGSVIERALENAESIMHDKLQWQMTANALLATHENRDDVLAAAHARERSRAQAEVASRGVVEMGVCVCPASGGVAISEADFDRLLALLSLLIFAAYSSDAVKFELAQPVVTIFPNGEFSLGDDYTTAVVRPYMVEHFAQEFTGAAGSYAGYYDDPRRVKAGSVSPAFAPDFIDAFRAEFGTSPEALIVAVAAIERDAVRDGRLIVRRTLRELRELLAAAKLPPETADCLFQHFFLWPRGDWDKTPAGFRSKDWYPWRFRRRLSLVARPFVRVAEGDEAPVVFAPGIVHDAVGLLFERLLNGHLPSEDFGSPQMRSWIGKATQRLGLEFEVQVAEKFRGAGLNALVGRPMTEFGADESYGDVDVLAWWPDGNAFYIVECKRLRFAQTVAEIGEQLREFKGEEMDRLARHVRRCQWLEEHRQELGRVTGTNARTSKVASLLVTSTVVPMQFTKGLPIPARNVVPISRLAQMIQDVPKT